MEENLEEKKHSIRKTNPKIYSIHSQKGGVGKTSIAIAIAGFEAIFNHKKVLLIDADLTGTSIKDILRREKKKSEKNPLTYTFNNKLILAAPDTFEKNTPIFAPKKGADSSFGLSKFYNKSEIEPKIYFSPSSPLYEDILEIIPLISQEDYLHFFRHRFEDIIVAAMNEGFEIIIIDLPPGFYGLSKNICDMMFDQIINKIEKDDDRNPEPTRMDKLFNSVQSNSEKTIESHVIFVTTADRTDYNACIPLFCSYMQKGNRNEKFRYKKLKKNEKNDRFTYTKLNGSVDFIFNKMKPTRKGEIVDELFAMKRILDNLSKDLDKSNDDIKNLPDVIQLLEQRNRELGAVSCKNIDDFSMKEILSVIRKIYETRNNGINVYEDGIIGWCMSIARTLNITDLVVENGKYKFK